MAKCSECGAVMGDPTTSCPVCGARMTASSIVLAQRILKGDNLRALGVAVGVLGIVVLLSEGSPKVGMVALGLAVALYFLGSVRS